MRKPTFVVLVVVLLLAAGCASMGNFFCKPDASQTTQAQKWLATAQQELAVLQAMPIKSAAVLATIAALQVAIPQLEQIVAGVCVTTQTYDNAGKVVTSGKTFANEYLKAHAGATLIE